MSTFEQLQRDPLITQEGAKDLLNFNSDTLNDEDMKEKLFDLKHDQDHRFQISWWFVSARLTLLFRQYSVGESVESMLEPAKLTFAEFERHYAMFPDEELKLKLWEANGYRYVMCSSHDLT